MYEAEQNSTQSYGAKTSIQDTTLQILAFVT